MNPDFSRSLFINVTPAIALSSRFCDAGGSADGEKILGRVNNTSVAEIPDRIPPSLPFLP
ncbi:hypothetical protein [Phormidium sp. CCY1219]|uniref:hypothetical protein n=1 Tax=Phormidium sp. CCY1219 TaxID=2886104 RepID=UPI002D1EF121|nr:hypothetical protein [Phormidium sp. CCY1219]MEB3829958.1 hypothetical protein [Phormidium sp. CCY1219]